MSQDALNSQVQLKAANSDAAATRKLWKGGNKPWLIKLE